MGLIAFHRALARGLTAVMSGVLAIACGDATNSDAGTGGAAGTPVGGAGGTAASGGTAGSPGGAAGSGGSTGCVDIHVISDMLPKTPIEFAPGSIGQIERDMLWRDDDGLHLAWNPWMATGSRAVVSSFDPTTGQSTGHRVFETFAITGVGRSDTGKLAFGGSSISSGGQLSSGVLLLDALTASTETYVELYSQSNAPIHVAWDGEAFAVHFWGGSGLEVSRVSPSGQVLLPPTVFGVAAGFQPDLRMSTDPVSGVSFAVSGQFEKVPWISAHTREGKPVAGTEAQGGKILPVNGALGSAQGVGFHGVRGVPGGALVTWSIAGSNPDAMVVVQEIDAALNAVGDVVLVPPTPFMGVDTTKRWLTAQPRDQGWWLGASGATFLEGIELSSGNLTVENLSTFELARSGQQILDYRHLASAAYGDELWLGFEDLTAGDSLGKLHQPYRIVRILPGCVYPSVWDLNQK